MMRGILKEGRGGGGGGGEAACGERGCGVIRMGGD